MHQSQTTDGSIRDCCLLLWTCQFSLPFSAVAVWSFCAISKYPYFAYLLGQSSITVISKIVCKYLKIPLDTNCCIKTGKAKRFGLWIMGCREWKWPSKFWLRGKFWGCFTFRSIAYRPFTFSARDIWAKDIWTRGIWVKEGWAKDVWTLKISFAFLEKL